MAARTRPSQESGLSLVEEVVALAVVSLGIILVVVMISTGVRGVTAVNDRSTAEGLARSQLELAKNAPYSPDLTAAPYPTVVPIPPYSVTTSVEYWTAPSGPFTTTVMNSGLQKVIVRVIRDASVILQVESYKVQR